jgi:hypothetical protein
LFNGKNARANTRNYSVFRNLIHAAAHNVRIAKGYHGHVQLFIAGCRRQRIQATRIYYIPESKVIVGICTRHATLEPRVKRGSLFWINPPIKKMG